ncbi:MAG: patatin-like phospholipase family protein [Nocardioides sp.]|uniref:patatin-like phospholipase family protein n=1 Tax=Nocardioides sp. TaxID=35761 RepID=UPI0039E2228F
MTVETCSRSSVSVSDALRQRTVTGSKRGHRSDAHTIALALEGGGLRGVISAGMAAVVEELGLIDAFDLVVGTSAGAVNAAALRAGQIAAFADAYVDTFSSRYFIDSRRMLLNRPVVRMDRLIDHTSNAFGVSLTDHRYDFPIAFVATSISTGKAVPHTDFNDEDDFLGSLAASGLLPLVGGAPVSLRGDRWLDGGLVDPIPVAAATGLGATHVLVLATRPPATSPRRTPMDGLVERYLHRHNPALGVAYRGRPAAYLSNAALSHSDEHPHARTLVLSPSAGDTIPSRLERDQDVLRQALAQARVRAHASLAGLVTR